MPEPPTVSNTSTSETITLLNTLWSTLTNEIYRPLQSHQPSWAAWILPFPTGVPLTDADRLHFHLVSVSHEPETFPRMRSEVDRESLLIRLVVHKSLGSSEEEYLSALPSHHSSASLLGRPPR